MLREPAYGCQGKAEQNLTPLFYNLFLGDAMPTYKCPVCGREVKLREGSYYCKVCGPEAVMYVVEGSGKSVNDLKDEVCKDILKKLDETGQVYIIDHDYPISVSKTLFKMLDDKRREMARKLGVPEEQYEFEDLFWDLLRLGGEG